MSVKMRRPFVNNWLNCRMGGFIVVVLDEACYLSFPVSGGREERSLDSTRTNVSPKPSKYVRSTVSKLSRARVEKRRPVNP